MSQRNPAWLQVFETGLKCSALSVGTVETFNEMLSPNGNEADILHTLCSASEFSQIKVRKGGGDQGRPRLLLALSPPSWPPSPP